MNNKKTAIILMGPTACGKTDLALELSKVLPIEVISVDSAQIYIGMDIGTNKPDQKQLLLLPHHLIDICHPANSYSVAQFCHDAVNKMEEIHANGKIPVLVGGTMLYFYGLCFGLSQLPSKNSVIRDQINDLAERSGWPEMHARLTTLDPELAKKINPNDKQRIQRALEVIGSTEQKFSVQLSKNYCFLNDWNINYFAILYNDRSILHHKIEERFYNMINQGFIEEVELLLKSGIPVDAPAIKCVGYRQISEYLQNKSSKVDACQKVIYATRQLAKRQYTWLRKWQKLVNLNLFYADDKDKLKYYIESIKIIAK